jgi:predicted unusual protein kinase regulating ubiquinone biosynthesis (AarF/ABC1/UbiB family)
MHFCHGDLHPGNMCVQVFENRWRVLFENDELAFFIPPGLRCVVIDFGNSSFAEQQQDDRHVKELL